MDSGIVTAVLRAATGESYPSPVREDSLRGIPAGPGSGMTRTMTSSVRMIMSRRGLPLIAAASLLLAAAVIPNWLSDPASAAIGGRNLPADGRAAVFIGQTTPDLHQFRQQVLDTDPAFPAPDGVTLYTNITPGLCTGLSGPCNLNGNVDDFGATLAEYPGAALAVGLSLSDNPNCTNQPLRAVIGRTDADLLTNNLGQQYRTNLDALITYLRDTGRLVFLRIGYEFDGPWNCYNADFYKQAFRAVKQRIDALGARKVATVWQTAAYPKDGSAALGYDFSNPAHLSTWYPGDDVVDWTGFSAFYWDRSYRQYQWACDTPTATPGSLYNAVLTFARGHGKPAMITESTPQGYRTAQLDASCTNTNRRVSLNGDWTRLGAWYDEYFGYITANHDVIKGVAYINSDWEAITEFACPPGSSAGSPGCPDGYWGNSRVQDNPSIYAGFKRELQNSQFVHGTLDGRGATWGGGSPTPTPTPTSGGSTPTPTPTPTGGSRDPFTTIEAETFAAASGVQIVQNPAASGGAQVGYTNDGDWIRFDALGFSGRPVHQITFRYSSGRPTNQAVTLEFRADTPTGPLIAAPGLLGTGSWSAHQQTSYNISNLPPDTTSIAVVWRATDSDSVADLDWLRFS